MENSVTTLETSRKLKAAGFPQTTGMIWNRLDLPDYRVEQRGQRSLAGELDVAIAAPTAQEMADRIYKERVKRLKWTLAVAGDMYVVLLEPEDSPTQTQWNILGNTLAEALANLYLALQEAK